MNKTKSPKVTSAYLKKWLQGEFDRLKIGYVVRSIYKTDIRNNQIDGSVPIFTFKVSTFPESLFKLRVFCYLNLSELQSALDNGSKLIWIPRDQNWIDNSTVTYR